MAGIKPFVLACLSVGLPVVLAAPPPDQPPTEFDAMSSVQSTMDSLSDSIGSEGAIRDKLAKPFMGEGNMQTFDGSVSFAGNITCKSSNEFMTVHVIPRVTGDFDLRLTQDKNLDGTPDRLYAPSIAVSGVCANGVIACTPGSWNDCNYYQWEATNGNDLILSSVHLNELGGCYCVNNHCGSNLLTSNLNKILNDLGGGSSAALMAKDSSFTVTQVFQTGPLITYFGQQSSQNMGEDGCNVADNSLTTYYSSPSSLSTDAEAATTLNPTSPVVPSYQQLVTSEAAQQDTASNHVCHINRNFTTGSIPLTDIIHWSTGSGGIAQCGPDCLRMTLGQVGNNYWKANNSANCELFEESVSFDVIQPWAIKEARLTYVKYDDHIQVRADNNILWSGPGTWSDNPITLIDGVPQTPGRCERTNSVSRHPNLDIMDILSTSGEVEFTLHVAVGDKGEGFAEAIIYADNQCTLSDDLFNDHCAPYRENPDCVLVREDVDGVTVFDNYVDTGLYPEPSSRQFGDESCGISVEREWWERELTYRCNLPGDYDFTEALQRQSYIQSTSTDTSYEDVQFNSEGSATFVAGTLPDAPAFDIAPCTLSCKTRKPRVANDVSHQGVASVEHHALKTVYDYFYRECTLASPVNGLEPAPECPVEDGEQIVTSCQCIDEFNDVTANVQAVRLASRDMVCSTGIPELPEISGATPPPDYQ